MKTIIRKIFKSIIILFFTLIVLLTFVVLFDLANYDSSYLNRNSLTFSTNNLNSQKIKRFFVSYEIFYNKVSSKIFKKRKDYWTPEDPSARANLDEIKIIPGKKINFVDGKKIENIEKNFSNWKRSHGGFSSMRFSSLELINNQNVKDLQLAWRYNSEDGKKGIEANPVVFDGLVYFPTPGNHIVCLNGKNGEEVWKFKVKKGYHAAKRGLLIWEDNKNSTVRLFFTNDDQLIALNARTGKLISEFGNEGVIKIGSSPSPPVIIDDQLIIGTFRPSIESYNLQNGKLNWKYYLRHLTKEALGKKDFRGGNPWGGISGDVQNGIVYLTTGNPWPKNTGTLRPGKNLLSNSLIAFDVRKRKKLWHFQETCHGLWNFDIAAPPILTTINKYDKRIDVVVAVTKLGNTLILDRYTGEPIFDYRMKLAPASKIPGEKTCYYQPYLKLPEPFARNIFKKDDVTDLTKLDREYVLKTVEKSNYGFFEPFEINKYTIFYNAGGGAQWTGASVDPYKNIMYVTANNIPNKVMLKLSKKSKFKYTNPQEEPLRDLQGFPGVKPPWGTLTALNLNNGKILWQVPLGYYEVLKTKGIITGTENYGGPTATAGGLVFVGGTLDKLIRAFNSASGEELWSYKLPYIGSAPPTTYSIDGEQYVIIPSTGGTTLKMNYNELVEQGDSYVAFKIK